MTTDIDALDVWCPTCQSDPGQRCTNDNGEPVYYIHQARQRRWRRRQRDDNR
jgi:hypothetical protein